MSAPLAEAPAPHDVIGLAQALIRCPSVTPIEGGALDLLESLLTPMGFFTQRLPFGEGAARVDNLYARWGDGGKHFCFAGHTDVVPTGELSGWTHDPFAAAISGDMLFGRGAADMKGAIAAFVAAVSMLIEKRPPRGSISLLITGDEEGDADFGTKPVLAALAKQGIKFDHCLVGEPSNPDQLGEMIKNGRRGSLNCTIDVIGVQGHVAYPDRAANPVPVLISLMDKLSTTQLDNGSDGFQPSNLEVVTFDVGNKATNVIPQKASARFNIRFNPKHSGSALRDWINGEVIRLASAHPRMQIEAKIKISGEAFYTPPSDFTDMVQQAVSAITGQMPQLSTTGGTSDARFIKDYCPVVEFGLVGASMHKHNEHVAVGDLTALTQIYLNLLTRYFDQ